MVKYTESKGVTTKIAFDEFDMVGWSALDASPIYKGKIVKFSIKRGVISEVEKLFNGDGSEYRPTAYRTFNNAFVPTYRF